MLNFQATKPACSTSPRNTLAAHCRPNNLLCKQHRLLPAAPFLPPFQQCQGMEHSTKTAVLACHCPEVAGLQAGLGAGSLCCSHGRNDSTSPVSHSVSPCISGWHPRKHWLTLHCGRAPPHHTDNTSALEHVAQDWFCPVSGPWRSFRSLSKHSKASQYFQTEDHMGKKV